MRLRLVREGVFFGDTNGLSPKGIEAARTAASRQKGQHGGAKGSGGLVDLFMNRPYHYREEDTPEDIVHLNPLNSVTQLPVLPDSPYARNSFRGAKIYYAFSVVPNEEYKGSEVESAYPSVSITKEQASEAGKLMRQVFDGADEFGRVDIKEVVDEMDTQFLGNAEFREHRSTLQRLKVLLPGVLDGMRKLKAKSIPQLVRFLAVPASSTRHKFTADVLGYAKESLAKKIKRPTGPGEEEMSRQILERSTNNFIRLFPQPFDFIVAPESSSDFNGKLIALLKSKSGADTPVVTLQKLLGRDVGVDMASLYDRARRYHDEAVQTGEYNERLVFTPERIAKAQQNTRSLNAETLPAVRPGESLTPMDVRWADYWVQSKVGTVDSELSAHQTKKPPIKAMQNVDKLKQYMQLYSGDGLDGVKKKRVLIVDDNVDNSSTMQMVHALVKERGASEVVIFSPFYMGN